MQVTWLKYIQPGNAAVQQNMILLINIMQSQCLFCVSLNMLAVYADKFHVHRYFQFQHGLLYAACTYNGSVQNTFHQVSLHLSWIQIAFLAVEGGSRDIHMIGIYI